VTLKLAETSVPKSRPSVPHGANLLFLFACLKLVDVNYCNFCVLYCQYILWMLLQCFFTESTSIKFSLYPHIFRTKKNKINDM